PEIDMPGHMQAALGNHPELQLADASGQRAPDKLDYTKPEARRFARELIEEYMALFPASEWHMGADEFLSVILPPTPADYARYPQLEAYAKATYGPTANAKDGFLGFVNDVDAIVRAHGKTLRVWNDGLDGGNARRAPGPRQRADRVDRRPDGRERGRDRSRDRAAAAGDRAEDVEIAAARARPRRVRAARAARRRRLGSSRNPNRGGIDVRT